MAWSTCHPELRCGRTADPMVLSFSPSRARSVRREAEKWISRITNLANSKSSWLSHQRHGRLHLVSIQGNRGASKIARCQRLRLIRQQRDVCVQLQLRILTHFDLQGRLSQLPMESLSRVSQFVGHLEFEAVFPPRSLPNLQLARSFASTSCRCSPP